MKSRKLWVGIPLLVVFTVLFAVILTSCDEPVDKGTLLGFWWPTQARADEGDTNNASFEFKSDGNVKVRGSATNYSNWKSYAYELKGSKITIKDNSSLAPDIETTISINADYTELKIDKTCYQLLKGTYYKPKTDSGSSSGSSEPDTYVDPPTPTVSPYKITYDIGDNITVTLSAESGAAIRYTTDDTTPNTSSTLYNTSTPITITSTSAGTKTLKAIAIKDGNSSGVMEVTFTFTSSTDKPAKPTANPAAGAVASGTTVTLSTTTSGAEIYYTTNGTDPTTSSTKGTTVTITAATTIKAIAVKDDVSSDVLTAAYTILSLQSAITVNSTTDNTTTAETTQGTLRYAIKNIANNGTITISLSAGAEIKLVKQLTITASGIKIIGNGVIISPDTSYPSTLNSLILIQANKAVDISGVHFKNGKDTSTASSAGMGAAIYNTTGGSLVLESCIFNYNVTKNGGAIYNEGSATAIVRGCTFYNNSATASGGAIYHNTGTLTLLGNIFHGNTATTSGPIIYVNGTGAYVTSGGYNVSDVTLVTVSSGSWSGGSVNDKLLSAIGGGISSPFAAGDSFSPAISLYIVPTGTTSFPTTDFIGATRADMAQSGNIAPGAMR